MYNIIIYKIIIIYDNIKLIMQQKEKLNNQGGARIMMEPSFESTETRNHSKNNNTEGLYCHRSFSIHHLM